MAELTNHTSVRGLERDYVLDRPSILLVALILLIDAALGPRAPASACPTKFQGWLTRQTARWRSSFVMRARFRRFNLNLCTTRTCPQRREECLHQK